jgi:hypothetical protein
LVLEDEVKPPLAIEFEVFVPDDVRLKVGYGAEELDVGGFPPAESPPGDE